MAGFFDLIRSRNAGALAIVGLTKNVGKTVTLNYLTGCFTRAGTPPGLVSAGYDGESYDRLTLKEKPRIYAPAGSIVATARACFEAAGAHLSLLEQSRFSTPLGEICLGRAERAGRVELAGPGSAAALRRIVERMRFYGAERVLVDGAINRLASASPAVTGAVILATGAAAGAELEDVVRKTVFRRDLLLTSRPPDRALLAAAEDGLHRGEAALLHREGTAWRAEPLHAPLPLLAGELIRARCRANTPAVVLGGALVDPLLEMLGEPGCPVGTVLLRDATRIFVSPEIYHRFTGRGGKIGVLRAIDLLAVTLNPADPAGKGYEPRLFLERMTRELAPCPVFDLVLEEGAAPG